MKKLEKRMYFLVPYNISPIQQGIQAGHAVVEYGLEHGKNKEYEDWAVNWKTFIILNGGTSNSGLEKYYGMDNELGSMEQHLKTLKDNGIICSWFKEPDLNYCLTGISFIVDERVFNKKEYLDFDDWYKENETNYKKEVNDLESVKNAKSLSSHYNDVYNISYEEMAIIDAYKDIWKKYIGGEKIIFLRNFLKNFRLA